MEGLGNEGDWKLTPVTKKQLEHPEGVFWIQVEALHTGQQ